MALVMRFLASFALENPACSLYRRNHRAVIYQPMQHLSVECYWRTGHYQRYCALRLLWTWCWQQLPSCVTVRHVSATISYTRLWYLAASTGSLLVRELVSPGSLFLYGFSYRRSRSPCFTAHISCEFRGRFLIVMSLTTNTTVHNMWSLNMGTTFTTIGWPSRKQMPTTSQSNETRHSRGTSGAV